MTKRKLPTTYKGKLTQKQKQKEAQKIALSFLLTFLILFSGWVMKEMHLFSQEVQANTHSIQSYTKTTQKNKAQGFPDAKDKNLSELTIQQRIARIARKENRGEWTSYLQKLAYCESRFDPNAQNSQGNNPSWSVDRGLFQYNSHWQAKVSDECAFSVECSVRKTIELIEKGKQHLWVCDKIVKGVPKHIVMKK